MKRLALTVLVICSLIPVSASCQNKLVDVYNSGNSGLPNSSISALAVDNEGNIWVGTLSGGIARFNGEHWTIYNTGNSELPSNDVYAIAVDNKNREWIGTYRGLARFDGGKWEVFNTDNSHLPADYIVSLAIDSSGRVWIGTFDNGIAAFDAGNWKVYDTDNSGLPDNHVQSITVDRAGNKWVGTADGLVRFDGKNWTKYDRANGALADNVITALACDPEGVTWVGTLAGLSRFDGSYWQIYDSKNSGLPDNSVLAVSVDASGNKWVGTSGGATEYDGNSWLAVGRGDSVLRQKGVVAIAAQRGGDIILASSNQLAIVESGLGSSLKAAKKLISERDFEGSIQAIRKFMVDRDLNQLGYTKKFLDDMRAIFAQGKTDTAYQVLQKLNGVTLRHIMSAYVTLAAIFQDIGDPQTSIGILNRVIANDPENVEAKSELMSAYYYAGDYKQIIDFLKNTTSLRYMRYLALAYEKTSMWARSNTVWRTIKDSSKTVSQSEEAAQHIRQNTIALMTVTQKQPESGGNPIESLRREARSISVPKEATPDSVYQAGNVDMNIPSASEKHPNAVALILAIQHYQSPGIPQVKYARNDAEAIREYLTKALGFRPENILPMNPDEQLTYGRIQTYIRSILPSYLKPDGSSELFVYFTGHGAPSTATHEAYLVPWDGDPNYVSNDNAYEMKQFYTDIEKLNARKKIIVVDACFSGQAGNGQSLIKYASPALLKVNNPLVGNPNTVIFQSCGPDQVSNWYDAKRHGMFTYFFLKGLQGAADLNGDGKITAEEMIRYIDNLDDGLPYYSNRLYQRPQKAELDGDGNMIIERIDR